MEIGCWVARLFSIVVSIAKVILCRIRSEILYSEEETLERKQACPVPIYYSSIHLKEDHEKPHGSSSTSQSLN
jgi:hypothetical protein